jgi:hypothetical protein
MSTLEDYKEKKPIKMLLMGDTGTAKTGSLASLANAGYKLHILDYDNGLDILSTTVKKECLKNVEYETLTEKKKVVNGEVLPAFSPKAFSKGLALLTEWANKYTSLEDVIVIDSLTFMSDAALEFVQAGTGHLGRQPEIQEWGIAMSKIEDVLAILYSEDVQCNVIINSHIKYIQDESTGIMKAQINTLGTKLPPKVGRYFNHMLLAQMQGSKRILKTKATAIMGLKSPNPQKVKDSYDVETGLADYFRDVKA